MPSLRHFSSSDPTRTSATPLGGFCGRLTLAAAVLDEVRSLEAAGRSPPSRTMPNAGKASASLDGAMVAYEDGRWADAYAAAAGLADAGDPCGAKLALLMLRHGDRLYGVAFAAEPRRIARWAEQVLQANRGAREATAVRRELQSVADPLLATTPRLSAPPAPPPAAPPRPVRSPPSRSSSTSCTA